MLNAEIVYPKTVKPRKRITCEDCGVDYSKKSYSILFKANKIAYFNVVAAAQPEKKPILLCHLCLFDVLSHIVETANLDDGLDFTVIDKENEYKFNFISSDLFNDDDEDGDPDAFLEQFKK